MIDPILDEGAAAQPLLSICIPNYNRADWLAASLRAFAPQVQELNGLVELCVADNCSEEAVAQVVEDARRLGPIRFHRHASNLGPFPNIFHLLDKMATGRYVWLLGNDDLPRPGAVRYIAETIGAHLDLPLFYVNYSVWEPSYPGEVMGDPARVPLRRPYGSTRGDDHPVDRVQDLIAYDTNLFTPSFSCILRREDAVEAYRNSFQTKAWESLESTLPAPVYIARHLMNAPAWHFGEPLVIPNLDSTWTTHQALYVLKILPALLDRFEEGGADRAVVDRQRRHHLGQSGAYMRRYLLHRDAPQNADLSLRHYLWQHRQYPEIWKALFVLLALTVLPDGWQTPLKRLARGVLRFARSAAYEMRRRPAPNA